MGSSVEATRVVVVDDEYAVGDLLALILRRAGYEVGVARNGLAGLVLCETMCPALVITDIVMPGMEGIEFLRRLRKTRKGTPVIAISGHAVGASFLNAARLLGAREVLRKPVSEKTLLETIDGLLAGG